MASSVYALDNYKVTPKASSYTSVNSGLRHIQVVPSGLNTPIIDTRQNLSSGTATTVLAYSDLSLITKWSFLADNNAAPSSGNFNIRFINAYDPAPEGIDIYVLPPAADFFNSKPNVSHLQEGAASGYVSLPAGTYDILVTVGGNKDVLTYTPNLIAFAAGQVRTAVYATSIQVLADAG